MAKREVRRALPVEITGARLDEPESGAEGGNGGGRLRLIKEGRRPVASRGDQDVPRLKDILDGLDRRRGEKKKTSFSYPDGPEAA